MGSIWLANSNEDAERGAYMELWAHSGELYHGKKAQRVRSILESYGIHLEDFYSFTSLFFKVITRSILRWCFISQQYYRYLS